MHYMSGGISVAMQLVSKCLSKHIFFPNLRKFQKVQFLQVYLPLICKDRQRRRAKFSHSTNRNELNGSGADMANYEKFNQAFSTMAQLYNFFNYIVVVGTLKL